MDSFGIPGVKSDKQHGFIWAIFPNHLNLMLSEHLNIHGKNTRQARVKSGNHGHRATSDIFKTPKIDLCGQRYPIKVGSVAKNRYASVERCTTS